VKLGKLVAEVHTLAVGVLDKLTDKVLLGVAARGDLDTRGLLVPETEDVWVKDPTKCKWKHNNRSNKGIVCPIG
jgi:hypothetical protein